MHTTVVFNWGQFCPQGTFGNVWRPSGYHWMGGKYAIGILMGRSQGRGSSSFGAQDSSPTSTMKNYLTQNVNSAKIKKPWNTMKITCNLKNFLKRHLNTGGKHVFQNGWWDLKWSQLLYYLRRNVKILVNINFKHEWSNFD